MSKSGSYSINQSRRNDSLKSFFCVFLIFLALLLLIYLLMVTLKEKPGDTKERKTDGGQFAKLQNGERFNENNSDEDREIMTSTKATKNPVRDKSTSYATTSPSTTYSDIDLKITVSPATSEKPTTTTAISTSPTTNPDIGLMTTTVSSETTKEPTTTTTISTSPTTNPGIGLMTTTVSSETSKEPTTTTAIPTSPTTTNPDIGLMTTTVSSETLKEPTTTTAVPTSPTTNPGIGLMTTTVSSETSKEPTTTTAIPTSPTTTNPDIGLMTTTVSSETLKEPTTTTAVPTSPTTNPGIGLMTTTVSSETSKEPTTTTAIPTSPTTNPDIGLMTTTVSSETPKEPTTTTAIPTSPTTTNPDIGLMTTTVSSETPKEPTTTTAIPTSPTTTNPDIGLMTTTVSSETLKEPTTTTAVPTSPTTNPGIGLMTTTVSSETSKEPTTTTAIPTSPTTTNPDIGLMTTTVSSETLKEPTTTTAVPTSPTTNPGIGLMTTTVSSETSKEPTTTTAIPISPTTTNPDIGLMTTTVSSETLKEPTTTTAVPKFIPPPNKPPCEHPVCKRAASTLLALMNHDEGTKPCEDFYKYSCGGQLVMEESFFQKMFEGLVKTIHGVNASSEKYLSTFSNFYQSCIQFETSLGMMDRLKFFNETDSKPITNTFIDMILTQSMPFFDIGLSISESRYIFQVTIPESGILKTSLRKWSVYEQMKEECLQEETELITDNTLYLKNMVDDIKNCIQVKTEDYIRKYAEEMRMMSRLPSMDFLGKLCAKEHEDGLMNITKTLQELLLSNYKTNMETTEAHDCKVMSLTEFKSLIMPFGLNWTELFQGIANNINIKDDTSVEICHLDYLKTVFDVFNGYSNLEGIFNLWSNIQLYRNTVIDHQSLKRQTFCMELATELMPDVTAGFVHNLAAKQRTEVVPIVKDLFITLKLHFEKSLDKVNKNGNSNEANRKRLQEIELETTRSEDFVSLNDNYQNVDISNDSYQPNLKNLIRNYRKTQYSLVHKEPTPETLLKYFMNPFETKPRMFYLTNYLVFHPGFLYGVHEELPDYTKLAKLAFPLAEQLLTFFKKRNLFNDFLNYGSQPIIQSEHFFIEDVEYGLEGEQYKINNTGCQGQCLDSGELEIDNAAFKLIADTFEKSDDQIPLIYLDESFSNKNVFLLLSTQDFCSHRSLTDFLRDFYDGRLPAPIKMKNMMKNSKLFEETYKCTEL